MTATVRGWNSVCCWSEPNGCIFGWIFHTEERKDARSDAAPPPHQALITSARKYPKQINRPGRWRHQFSLIEDRYTATMHGGETCSKPGTSWCNTRSHLISGSPSSSLCVKQIIASERQLRSVSTENAEFLMHSLPLTNTQQLWHERVRSCPTCWCSRTHGSIQSLFILCGMHQTQREFRKGSDLIKLLWITNSVWDVITAQCLGSTLYSAHHLQANG